MTLRALSVFVLSAVGLLAGATSAFAAPGNLDHTFSGDGYQKWPDQGLAGIGSLVGPFTDVQADGRIILAGGNPNIHLVRLLPNGDVDRAFGAGGRVVLSTGRGGNVRDLGVGGDGSIFVLHGDSVLRVTPAGVPDPAFSEDGFASTELDVATAIFPLPDGGVAVAGRDENSLAIARLDRSGDPDASFSDDGVVRESFGREQSIASAILRLPNGQLRAIGTTSLPSSQNALAQLQVLTDGIPDTTFSGDGHRESGLGAAYTVDEAVLGDDGRVTVKLRKSNHRAELIRILPDGSPDGSFAWPGASALGLSNEVGIEVDGGLTYIAGWAGCERCFGWDFALVRLAPDGAPDPGFSGDGVSVYDLDLHDGPTDLALAPDGKPVVVGQDPQDHEVIVARYQVDPANLDADGDGLLDARDRCPEAAGTADPDGCPDVPRAVSLFYQGRDVLTAQIDAANRGCVLDQELALYRRVRGPDARVARERTNTVGIVVFRKNRPPGRYYARVPVQYETLAGRCERARSEPVRSAR